VKKLETKPFALVGVAANRHEPGKLAEVMAREDLPWRTFDDSGAVVKKWNLSGTPTLYLIDPAGVIRRKWVGAPGEAALDAAIESLLAEAERASPK